MENIVYTNQIKCDDIIQMKNIWQDVFGDERIYIDHFFDEVYEPKLTFVAKYKNNVIATLYMIEYSYVKNEQKYNLLYLYALATKKDYRKQGIMSRLIEHANIYAVANNFDALFLIPAGINLIPYYVKNGFHNFVKNESMELSNMVVKIQEKNTSRLYVESNNQDSITINVEVVDIKVKKISIEEGIQKIIQASDQGLIFSKKDQNKLRLFLTSLVESGGDIISILHKEKEVAFAVIKIDEQTIRILNTNIKSEWILSIELELKKLYRDKKIIYQLSDNVMANDFKNIMVENNEHYEKNIGLIKILDKTDGLNILVQNQDIIDLNLQMVLD